MMQKGQPTKLPITVVLVDDNPGFQAALARHLREFVFLSLVAVAGSGQEALALPASLNPDVVLLDIHLPDGSGLYLIGPLLQRWAPTKVIALSFDDYPRVREAALAAGATAFVSKINAADRLVPAIRKAIDGQAGGGSDTWKAAMDLPSGYW
jgi:DNA-binding NarL/FixJ family response regulator